jgi:tetratricopeptide (TPR) repeat protein
MPLDQTPIPNRDQLLERAVTTFLKAAESGARPDRREWLSHYPQIAAELSEFFSSQDQVEELAAPLRALTDAPAPPLPAAFGNYELLEEIGRGGMGVVYKARQRDPDRIVALKVIRAGALASADDLQRFKAEANAAAGLAHPNIVAIHEVGEIDRQPYFTMPYLPHGSLAQKIGRVRQVRADAPTTQEDPRRAAEILVKIARAIYHAHQYGILHRDLKPSNILLDERDEPHVCDFGLARRVDKETGLTLSGAILGTPAYMAPEQAVGKKAGLTVAADVYGLGAILYALLTGRPPFQGETPLDTLAQVESTDPEHPGRLNSSVDRDLGIICLKCLEKDPARRFPSAQALAEDLERWLAGKPIVSRPVSRAEQVWRWCRRNPAKATAAGIALAAVLALGASTVFIWLGWSEAARQRDLAERQRERADRHYQQARAVDQMLTRIATRLANVPHMEKERRELLQEMLRSYEGFLEAENVDSELRQETGKAYLRIGELQNDLGSQDKARDAFQSGQAVFEQLTADFPDRADYWVDLARCYEGPAWSALDDPRETELACRRALEIRERLAREHPAEPSYLDDLAQNYRGLGLRLQLIGKFDDAEHEYRRGVGIAETLHASHPDVAGYRKTLASALAGLGQRLLDAGRYAEAEPLLRRALILQQKLIQEFPLDVSYREASGYWYWHLGQLLEKTGEAREAEEAYKAALAIQDRLGAEFPDLPANRAQAAIVRARGLGPLLYQQFRFAEAEQAYRQALEIYQKLAADYTSGYMHKLAVVNLGETYGNLGEMLLNIGRRDEAKQACVREEAICREAAKDFPDVAENRSNWAECLRKQGELLQIDGRLPEAEQMFLRSLTVIDKVVSEWPTVQLYRDNLATVHLRLAVAHSLAGNGAQAESSFRRALDLWDKLIADSPDDPKYRHELSLFLASFPDEKLRAPRRAEQLIEPVAKQQPKNAQAWLTLGIARCRQGQWRTAVLALEKSVELRNGGESNEWFYLAMARAHLGEKEQARKSYERAVQWMDKNRPKDPELGRVRAEVQGQLK